MKIVVISDSHDREEVLKKLVDEINQNIKPSCVIHCGDLVAPFMLNILAKLNCKCHIIWGNVVGDIKRAMEIVEKHESIIIHGIWGEIEENGKKIAFVHEKELAIVFALSKKYDVVFYGHTHKANIEEIEGVLLVNPGELLGRKQKPSYAIYDVKENKVEIKEIKIK